jgi:hypothetical protein
MGSSATLLASDHRVVRHRPALLQLELNGHGVSLAET